MHGVHCSQWHILSGWCILIFRFMKSSTKLTRTLTKLRDAWHQYRDGILELACNKSAVNTALKTTTDAVTTDAVMDQYNEGLDFLQHTVIWSELWDRSEAHLYFISFQDLLYFTGTCWYNIIYVCCLHPSFITWGCQWIVITSLLLDETYYAAALM